MLSPDYIPAVLFERATDITLSGGEKQTVYSQKER
jgi:hypothetical protein